MKKQVTAIGAEHDPEISGADPAEGIAQFFGVTEPPVPYSLDVGEDMNGTDQWTAVSFPPEPEGRTD